MELRSRGVKSTARELTSDLSIENSGKTQQLEERANG